MTHVTMDPLKVEKDGWEPEVGLQVFRLTFRIHETSVLRLQQFCHVLPAGGKLRGCRPRQISEVARAGSHVHSGKFFFSFLFLLLFTISFFIFFSKQHIFFVLFFFIALKLLHGLHACRDACVRDLLWQLAHSSITVSIHARTRPPHTHTHPYIHASTCTV